MSIWKSVVAGALGGLAGAFAMNQFQALVSAVSKSQEQPQPENQDEDATIKTARALSRELFHHELTKEETKWAGPLVHYSMGKVMGAAYGAVAEKFPVAGAGLGTAYGALVWLLADEIAVPLFGFAKGPEEYPLSSHVNALASHLVYGFITGLTRKLLIAASDRL